MQPLRRHAYAALSCPICRADLNLVGRSFHCRLRHTFDLARSGYVNLAVGRAAKAGGDTADQLQRRRAFLAAGAFDFIADAIVAHTRRQRRRATPVVLDAGCGTGYHLDRVTRGLAAETGRPCAGLGIDLAKVAARMAAGERKALAFAVADVWSDWPVGSAAADLLINVFAPKNFAEMARTLRPDGQLAVAYAGPEHLIELREMLGLMDPAARQGGVLPPSDAGPRRRDPARSPAPVGADEPRPGSRSHPDGPECATCVSGRHTGMVRQQNGDLRRRTARDNGDLTETEHGYVAMLLAEGHLRPQLADFAGMLEAVP